jgi:hypothetical protein
MPHAKQVEPSIGPSPGKLESVVRRNQATIEIPCGTLSDTAIQGLVDDWIAPMVVDCIIERMVGCDANARSQTEPDTETGDAEAHVIPAPDVDDCEARNTERTCGTREPANN